MKLIAVYGTLREGCGNHRVMGDSQLLGVTKTPANFTLFDNGGFPFVHPSGNTAVTIEIYNVTNENTLRGIYGLEGYTGVRGHARNWYNTVDVQTQWGVAEMFVCREIPNLPIIQSGDWLKRHE